MSEYMKLVQDTKKLTTWVILKEDIVSLVLIALCVVLAVLAGMLLWSEHKERKAQKAARWNGKEYLPTVTETVQVDQYGTEYHRMGIPGKGV